MEYNKTKRGLEKAAGIVGLVISTLKTLSCAILFIIGLIGVFGGFNYFKTNYNNISHDYTEIYNDISLAFVPILIISLILLVITILTVNFSAKVIPSPVNANGELQKRTGSRVCMLVFTILTGDLVSAGLMIAVLCLKDYKEAVPTVESSHINLVNANSIDQKINKFAQNLLEIKHLHELSVVDDENYKKTVQKLVDKFLEE